MGRGAAITELLFSRGFDISTLANLIKPVKLFLVNVWKNLQEKKFRFRVSHRLKEGEVLFYR